MDESTCWVFVTGDSMPFRAREAADLMVEKVATSQRPWLAIPCVFADPDSDPENVADWELRTAFIRSEAIVAITPAPPIE